MKIKHVQSKNAIVVHHNELIEAKFEMSTLELRIFIALVSRIKKGMLSFFYEEIPISELTTNTGGSAYQQLDEATNKLMSRFIVFQDKGKEKISLMDKCELVEGRSYVRAKFNDSVTPLLLKLASNFTIGQLEQILNIKSYYAYRFYWLLKQKQDYGSRFFDLEDLKEMLQVHSQKGYTEYSNFKTWIIKPVQVELENTDVAFEFSEVKTGRKVTGLNFVLKNQKEKALPAVTVNPDAPAYHAALLALGVSKNSLTTIDALISAGLFEAGYIDYCINYYTAKEKAGKIKESKAGAIFTAIVAQHLLESYKAEVAKKEKAIAAKTNPKPATKFHTKFEVLEDFRSTFGNRAEAMLAEMVKTGWQYENYQGKDCIVQHVPLN